MKKKVLLLAAVLATLGSLTLNNLQAQDTSNPAGATPPANGQAPNAASPGVPPPAAPPQFRMRPPRATFQQALLSLRRVKMELQRSTQDFDGHRQSAMDACDKAISELQAVIKAQGPMGRPMPSQGPPGSVAPAPASAPAPQAPPQ